MRSSNNEQEYTDYSCSTSIERLARDVETLLREWHLSQADRHISFVNPKKEWDGIQLIRSDQVNWVAPLQNGGKVTVRLRLDLWDGPSASSIDNHHKTLPLSLHRTQFSKMSSDLFTNLSTLFGIGQHITLSLAANEGSQHVSLALGANIIKRHQQKILAPWIVTSSLNKMLQMALQCACSNILCNLPAFGIWGTYQPISSSPPRMFPAWLQPCTNMPPDQTHFFRWYSKQSPRNRSFLPPVLSSGTLGGRTKFFLSILPKVDDTSNRLTVWGQLLLQHSSTPNVILCGAKHVHVWNKRFSASGGWRQDVASRVNQIIENVEVYRDECRKYALSIMESAYRGKPTEPIWGSAEDPIESVSVSVTWNGKGKAQPLLTFPLKIRSSQSMSRRDWIDMEDSVERTILDPFHSSSFDVSIQYDSDAILTPLAANQQLLLAAFIRTATLPANTSMQQLTKQGVTEWNTAEAEMAALNFANITGVGELTRRLVQAMDWKSAIHDMIGPWEAASIVKTCMDPISVLCFPGPPEGIFQEGHNSLHENDLFAPLIRSAPTARLLATLFVNMGRLRSPCSMALVWLQFVAELRRKWENRESLPNMNFVPGIDPSPEQITRQRCFSSIGLKADNAAFLYSSEPDPDDQHCLIGQQLQVFNLGIESMVAMEMAAEEARDEQVINDMEVENGSIDDAGKGKLNDNAENGASSVLMPIENSGKRESLASDSNLRFSTGDNTSKQNIHRKGVRCPVPGQILSKSGDQVYAPYLQRPQPLTNDIIFQRKYMLSRQINETDRNKKNLHFSIEIAQRFQKPKLLSDMCAFLAANPDAIFQDFINWYGNPGNPLEDYMQKEAIDRQPIAEMIKQPMGIKMDLASEAMKVLNATRNFWQDTWNEAKPQPAIDQEALFDVNSTVEIVLDSFETIHPSSLLNQMVAVNLSMSYFALTVSAGNAIHVDAVKSMLRRLRQKVEKALGILGRDATYGVAGYDMNEADTWCRFASIDAIKACDEACTVLAETESLLCKVMSLLHKFPLQFEMVQELLSKPKAAYFSCANHSAKTGVLSVIAKQQKGSERLPRPSLREYILRNTDDISPSQLCVRVGEDGYFEDSGFVVALTKTDTAPSMKTKK